jgi:hypothetical protein
MGAAMFTSMLKEFEPAFRRIYRLNVVLRALVCGLMITAGFYLKCAPFIRYSPGEAWVFLVEALVFGVVLGILLQAYDVMLALRAIAQKHQTRFARNVYVACTLAWYAMFLGVIVCFFVFFM